MEKTISQPEQPDLVRPFIDQDSESEEEPILPQKQLYSLQDNCPEFVRVVSEGTEFCIGSSLTPVQHLAEILLWLKQNWGVSNNKPKSNVEGCHVRK